MAIPPSLKKSVKKRRKEVTPTVKKAKFTMKVFAALQSQGSLLKVVERATQLIDGLDSKGNAVVGVDKLECFIAGTNAIAKILPYILPKQSDGNALQVQINNNLIAGETTKDGKITVTLEQLVKSRGLNTPNEAESVEYIEVKEESEKR